MQIFLGITFKLMFASVWVKIVPAHWKSILPDLDMFDWISGLVAKHADTYEDDEDENNDESWRAPSGDVELEDEVECATIEARAAMRCK